MLIPVTSDKPRVQLLPSRYEDTLEFTERSISKESREPIVYRLTLPLLYVRRVHLSFKLCRVHFVAFRLLFLWWKILLAYNVDPKKTLHKVASDLGLHCLPMMLSRDSR